MKFEYIEYHKSASNDELITDLKETAKQLGVSSLSMREYDENGKFSRIQKIWHLESSAFHC